VTQWAYDGLLEKLMMTSVTGGQAKDLSRSCYHFSFTLPWYLLPEFEEW